MNISKAFFITGALWLLIGMALGMHMGASENFTLAPVHAHINLLGFVLMTLFGLSYRLIPALAETLFGRIHFWLHQIGALGTLVGLYLLLSGTMPGIVPVMAASEGLVFLATVAWAINLIRTL
jgi:cbb3-type cytochrome oxidase subunit 1